MDNKIKDVPTNAKLGKQNLTNETNPCQKEMDISFRCVLESKGNKDLCGLEFENYKRCRQFWLKVLDDRKRNGIRPLLPKNQEERDKIIKMYKEARST